MLKLIFYICITLICIIGVGVYEYQKGYNKGYKDALRHKKYRYKQHKSKIKHFNSWAM